MARAGRRAVMRQARERLPSSRMPRPLATGTS
jgi:hypothetical protein